MKTRDFERYLTQEGYALAASGSHKKFIKGSHAIMVVHGREMNKMVVRRLLKEVERNRQQNVNSLVA